MKTPTRHKQNPKTTPQPAPATTLGSSTTLRHKISQHAKYTLITIFCLIISAIAGFFAQDLAIGGSILATGLLCAYFASEGKRINYILGLINYLLIAYVALENNLYGIAIFYTFVFAPLQIYGFFSWSHNLNQNKDVKARAFTLKTSVIITITCIVSSVIVGLLLNLIPNQQLIFLDAASNCINLCSMILLALRFKESWWLWLINNIIDLVIWSIAVSQHGIGAVMMLLASIGFLIINIYGLIRWELESKKEKPATIPIPAPIKKVITKSPKLKS